MRRRLTTPLVSTALLFACQAAAGLEPIELHTDREAFTPSTFAVDPGRVLVEGSHVYIDNREGLPTNNYPELIVRIGGSERLEWRLGFNYSVGSQGNVVTSVEAGELPIDGGTLYESNVLYGLKLVTSEQDDWIPQSCFIMEATTPTFGQEFGTEPVATAVLGWELPAHWRLDAALRYAYAESDVAWFSRWGPSVVARIPLTERIEIHAEYFGTFTQGLIDDVNRPFFSPGGHVMLSEHTELGWRFGWGLTRDAANFFSDAGLAFKY